MRIAHAATALLLAAALALPALAREPMPIDEDTPLDRRVLTRPGAVLWDAPEGGTAVAKPPVFTPYYVFDEASAGGSGWLELGANRDGAETAWVASDETVAWNQTITLTFTNPADRAPVLFFDAREELESFVADEAMSTRAELIDLARQQGQSVADTGVVAAEPAEHVSITEQFYLLPILDFERIRVNRRPRMILEVASVNLNDVPEPTGRSEPFPVGITFVVDTSTSMQPYIDRTKEAIRKILGEMRDVGDTADFSFGLIGFRSSVDRVPGLEYTAREFVPLRPDFDEAAFLAGLDEMNATAVSSHDFDEDGLSGLAAAAASQQWDAFGGRYIIYISDAGMLVGEDDGSAAGTTPALLSTMLREDLRIATYALFLETRPGRAYHADAIAQLETVAARQSGASRVFPIADGDVAAFGREVDRLIEALLAQVGTEIAGAEPPDCDPATDPIVCAAIEDHHAMSLDWLGRQNQTQAPTSYAAWAADFALDDPSQRAMTPRVLLTRAQLNDLYVTLQAMVEAYQQSTGDSPEKFFSVLKTVIARVMRDPSALPALDASQAPTAAAVDEFDDLGDLVSTYLQGLPYNSDLASETLEMWTGRDDSGRYDFIQGIKSKLRMYELYYADSSNWIALNAAANEAERVYPIPLEMMP